MKWLHNPLPERNVAAVGSFGNMPNKRRKTSVSGELTANSTFLSMVQTYRINRVSRTPHLNTCLGPFVTNLINSRMQ